MSNIGGAWRQREETRAVELGPDHANGGHGRPNHHSPSGVGLALWLGRRSFKLCSTHTTVPNPNSDPRWRDSRVPNRRCQEHSEGKFHAM